MYRVHRYIGGFFFAFFSGISSNAKQNCLTMQHVVQGKGCGYATTCPYDLYLFSCAVSMCPRAVICEWGKRYECAQGMWYVPAQCVMDVTGIGNVVYMCTDNMLGLTSSLCAFIPHHLHISGHISIWLAHSDKWAHEAKMAKISDQAIGLQPSHRGLERCQVARLGWVITPYPYFVLVPRERGLTRGVVLG